MDFTYGYAAIQPTLAERQNDHAVRGSVPFTAGRGSKRVYGAVAV